MLGALLSMNKRLSASVTFTWGPYLTTRFGDIFTTGAHPSPEMRSPVCPSEKSGYGPQNPCDVCMILRAGRENGVSSFVGVSEHESIVQHISRGTKSSSDKLQGACHGVFGRKSLGRSLERLLMFKKERMIGRTMAELKGNVITRRR